MRFTVSGKKRLAVAARFADVVDKLGECGVRVQQGWCCAKSELLAYRGGHGCHLTRVHPQLLECGGLLHSLVVVMTGRVW